MRTLLYLTAVLAAFGQTPSPAPRFDAADVHASPVTSTPFPRGPFLNNGRYDLRTATVVDLITRAYDLTPDKVLEGPNWVEYDRFDITAATPPKTSADTAKLMLQTLLAERFGLAIRNEERPLPAFVLTAPKGSQKLKEADGTGNTGCSLSLAQNRAAPPRPEDAPLGLPIAPTITYTCRNISMAAFADGLRTMAVAQQFIGTNPVKDSTGIEGRWDFNFKYTLPIGTGGDTVTLPEALDKQLGLKLEQQTASIAVVVVEKANRPSPNEPDVEKKIPAYAKEFEVATIRPFAPSPGGLNVMGMRAQPGGRVDISGLPLKSLLQQAFNIQADTIVGAPGWTDTDRYSIVAKIPGEGAAPAPNSNVDPESLALMLQTLLKERFQLEAHFEDRPVTAYTLTAPKPKLKKADPAGRIKLADANTTGGVMTGGGALPSRTIKLQNMTMAQFAEKLQYIGGTYIHAPVLDGTGLEGSYDFSLSFSPIAPEMLAQLMRSAAANNPNAGAAAPSADPIGGVTLFDAVDKQLGLKLVEQKRPVRVLVIDHIERQVTEN